MYEGFRVLPYSWALETPLSNTETRMDDVYKQVQDPALTVGFELETGERLLAWTTTPWTLPSNLALAVNPEIDYAVVELDGRRLDPRRCPARRYERELGAAERVGTIHGSELVGRSYTPLFPYFAGQPNSFRVLAGDFVSVEDGTGVVHIAPGFGEDDQRRLRASTASPLVVPVDARAVHRRRCRTTRGSSCSTPTRSSSAISRREASSSATRRYEHNYPHCWRTGRR